MRRQELDGFIEGLFGQKDAVDLPERAHRGLDDLGELRSLFAAALEVATHETKAATDKDMKTTLEHMHDMTKNAEHEMHAILLSCKRARRQLLAAFPAQKSLMTARRPTDHGVAGRRQFQTRRLVWVAPTN